MPRVESERSRRRRQIRLGLREASSVGAGVAECLPQGFCLPQRETLDAATAADLFAAIDAKDAPRFGLVKLAALELDALHAAPARAHERGGSLTTWAPTITLIAYAALRRRGGIAAALLRAGADPSIRWSPAGSATTEGVKAYIGSLRPCYSVWLLQKVVEMRRGGSLVPDSGAPLHSQSRCTARCPVCTTTCTEALLAWDGDCGHVLCETCFWRLQMDHNHVASGVLNCTARYAHHLRLSSLRISLLRVAAPWLHASNAK